MPKPNPKQPKTSEKIPTQESDTVEFKEITKDSLPKNIWEPITAFANADGGSIYYGRSGNLK